MAQEYGLLCNDCNRSSERDCSPNNNEPCTFCGSKNTVPAVYARLSVTTGTNATVSGSVYIPNDAPSILLQSVIIPVAKTSEGTLIEVSLVPWGEIISLIKSDPKSIFQIKPDRWEEIVAAAYEQAGFDEVILTPRSGDYGRDVIATKKGLGEVRIIDQVKAYKAGHLVIANDVRALMGILQTDGASKGFLTTTSDFAPRIKDDPLITPLIPQRLGLINGKQLVQRLQDIANKK
ncbi:Restriction endonuclease [Candidatus Electrothrix marina]|uniref:Restriction endonuclease n=1 Tax=Candidatus Electrothrix marina TaxID=1859130 RepID=A0A3S3QKX7_9BACT|nr:Restriction endonuclease [Candidatus Electrothrix marina]